MAALSNEYDELLSIIQSRDNRIYYNYKLDVDINGKIYTGFKVLHFDVGENYELNYCPDITVHVQFDAATYFRHIYPNRKNAKVIISRTLMHSLEDQVREGIPDKIAEYRLIDLENKDIDLQGQVNQDLSQTYYTAKFALIDLAIEQLRLTMVGGIFFGNHALDVLRYFIGAKSKQLELPDDLKPQGVNFVKPDMVENRTHIVIPPGTPLLSDLPTLMQEENGGIYNHNIGLFLKFRQWYIYPLYSANRYPDEYKVLDVVLLPPNRSPGVTRTYAMSNGRLMVAATGNVRQKDLSDIAFQNEGNGVRFGKASKLWDYAEVSGNKAVVKRSENMAEFLTSKRLSKLQNLRFSERRVTDNTADEISNLSQRQGYVLLLEWHHSNPDVLVPGMPVKIHSKKETGKEELMGTLLGVESNSSPDSGEHTSQRYSTNSVLSIFVSPYVK